MIEAAMIWNEPNNKSHWDPEIDPDWSMFGTTVIEAAKAIHSVNPDVKRVLGGISPIDPLFIQRLDVAGTHLDMVNQRRIASRIASEAWRTGNGNRALAGSGRQRH